ncbi:hypothetical protein [Bradyrhizobium sp. CCBAU 51753]|uniref:hypothetical protein n=1 Tax=Bradyrhizobium sp. CCBAU 51753 TaxID=1325100 RepID=UPI00188A124F|nr:hypothetical protein [Bradyrhizobium sp. CCBAU 51753]QOZ25283.1 hypothetical protein XH93_18065 [Bradyrhizobium sp. CCBAU 51753]
MIAYKNGQTSVVLRFKLLDSSSTVGAGLTGLTSASTGLRISTIADNESAATAYTVAGSTIESITTLGTYATPTATKCRFKEVDSTNHPGLYEFQLADARFAVSNAKSLIVSVSGATNLQQADFVVPLVVDDPYTAKLTDKTGYSLSQSFPANFASLAITAGGAVTAGTVSDKTGYSLSQTFPTNFASLSIDSSGRVDLAKIAGTSQTARDIGASVLLSAGTGTGQLDFTSGVVKSNLAQILGTALTETAGQIAAGFKKFFNIASPASTMDALTLVATATNLTNAPTSGDFTSTMKTSLNAATPAVTVSDKTGFTLASDGLAAVTAWTVAITGNITGNLSGSVGSVTGNIGGSVGSISGVAFPTNFGALGIGSGGHVLNVDTLTTYTGNTPQTGDAFALIGTAGAGLTAIGDTRLAHLDADVSSRLASSSYTAPLSAAGTRSALGMASANLDTQLATIDSDIGSTTSAIYARIGAPAAASVSDDIAAVASKTGNLPASPAATGDIPTAAAIRTEMDSNSTKLAHLDADVSSRSTYAGADTSGTTTLLARLTSTRAGLLDNLDAAVSSRSTFAGGAVASVTGNVAGSVGSVSGLTASDVGAIKAKTDSLTFTVSGKVDANITHVTGDAVTGSGTTGDPWGPA